MAKSLLLTVLADTLGNYVEGISRENMKFGIWSGKLELKNLRLKDSALDQLHLPIKVIKGCLNNLRINFSLSQIGSKPIEVFIDGIYLLASPMDMATCSPEEAKIMIKNYIKSKLAEVDQKYSFDSFGDTNVNETVKKASYFQQLATTVIENLEVTITNVHIRYEDSYTYPTKTFGVGFTIERISLSAADENWSEKFMKSTDKKDSSIRKLGKLQNLSCYWNSKSECTNNYSNEQWEIFMKNFNSQSDYVLQPFNDLVIRLEHREISNENTPKIEITVLSNQGIHFEIDKIQYQQFLKLNNSFANLTRKLQMAIYRPTQRPDKAPRDWWFYVFKLISGKERSSSGSKFESILYCLKNRSTYINYIKQRKVDEFLGKTDKMDHIDPLISSIEEKLPLVTLLTFREMANTEAMVRIAEIRKEQKEQKSMFGKASSGSAKPTLSASKPEKSSWGLSSFFSKKEKSPTINETLTEISKTQDEKEDEALLEDIGSKIENIKAEAEAALSQKFSFKASFAFETTLNMTNRKAPIGTLAMSVVSSVEMRETNIFLYFDLMKFNFLDKLTINPYNSYILEMKQENLSNNSSCSLSFTITPGKSNLKITSQPVIFYFNKECVQSFLDFVQPVKNELGIDLSSDISQSSSSFELSAPKSNLFIDIQVSAPMVIIPEYGSNVERVMVFDMGNLNLHGLMNDEQMSWDIKLNQINISAPEVKSEIFNPTKYLLKPFSIFVDVKQLTTEPEMLITIGFDSNIQAEFDSKMILRVYQVMMELLDGVTPKNEINPSNASTRRFSVMNSNVANTSTIKTISPIPESNPKGNQIENISKLKVKFTLETLTFKLLVADEQTLTLEFSTFDACYQERLLDSSFSFNLQSLVLFEEKQGKVFHLISSGFENDSTFKFNYYDCKSSISDYCIDTIQTGLNVNVGSIKFYLKQTIFDDAILVTENIFSQYKSYVFTNFFQKQSASPMVSNYGDSQQILPQSNKGTRIQFGLQSISLHLIDVIHNYEAFSFKVINLNALVSLKDKLTGKATLKSIQITDERKQIHNYHYNHLFTNVESGTDSSENMLDFSFHEIENKLINSILKTQTLHIIIIADVLADLGDLINSNVESMLRLLSTYEDLYQSLTNKAIDLSNNTTSLKNSKSETGYAFQITIQEINPSLFFLENPSKINTRAIVNKCFFSAIFSNRQNEKRFLENKLLISCTRSEISVISDMSKDTVNSRIVEPMDIQFSLETQSSEGTTILTKIYFNCSDTVRIRTSLQDFVLISNIISRIKKREEEDFQSIEFNSSENRPVNKLKSASASSKPNKNGMSIIDITSNISEVEIIIINDIHGENLPLIKFEASHAEFRMDGPALDLYGTGSIKFSSEYYNSQLITWEPIIESFSPSVSFKMSNDGVEFSVSSSESVQLNITGTLCHTIVSAVDLVDKMMKFEIIERDLAITNFTGLKIVNQTGLGIQVLDFSNTILNTQNIDSAEYILFEDSSLLAKSKYININIFNLNNDSMNYIPVNSIPTVTRKTKVYDIMPQSSLPNLSSKPTPITVEIYENERLDILSNSWKTPFMAGDPGDRWTNSESKMVSTKNSVKLQFGYKWREAQWKIEKSSYSDEEGWEYASSFLFLEKSKLRNGNCVRRRKWYRSMIPDHSNNKNFKLTIDILFPNDVSRTIIFRTTQRIYNKLPVDIEVGFQETEGEDDFYLPNIVVGSNSEICFPADFVDYQFIRLRHAHSKESGPPEMSWSHPIDISNLYSMTTVELNCSDNSKLSFKLNASSSDENLLQIYFLPHLTIENHLPCNIALVNESSNFSVITSGSSYPILKNLVNATDGSNNIKFKINDYYFEQVLPSFDSDLLFEGRYSSSGILSTPLIIGGKLIKDLRDGFILQLYSKLIVVDYTKLGVTLFSPGINSIRKTNNSLSDSFRSDLTDSWGVGANGMTIFHFETENFSFKLNDGQSESKDIKLSSLNNTKSNIEVYDSVSNSNYRISLKVLPFDLFKDNSQVLYIFPTYNIMNLTDKTLYLSQNLNTNNEKLFSVESNNSSAWHGFGDSSDTKLFIRLGESDWCYSAVDINDLGITSLLMCSNSMPTNSLNIEIRLSDPSDSSSFTILVWDFPSNLKLDKNQTVKFSKPINLAINNQTPFAIFANQKLKRELNILPLELQPMTVTPFGWVDTSDDLFICLNVKGNDQFKARCVNTLLIGETITIDDSQDNCIIKGVMITHKSGKILKLTAEYTSSSTSINASRKMSIDMGVSQSYYMKFKVSFACLAVSIIADKPTRRELFCGYFRDINTEFHQSMDPEEGIIQYLEFSMRCIQIDNFSETAIYPVLMYNVKREIEINNEKVELNFIDFSMSRTFPEEQMNALYKQIQLRVMDTKVHVDSASILIYLSDLHSDLLLQTSFKPSELDNSEKKSLEFTSEITSKLNESKKIKPNSIKSLFKSDQIFIEFLQIHPMSFSVTFEPIKYPRSSKSLPPAFRWLLALDKLAAIEDFAININSFLVENAMETVDMIITRITRKISRDFQRNLLSVVGNLFGSLNLLGKPAGLYKNIGGGVQDLFYEPYQGLMKSPLDFAKGVGKGSRSLVSGLTKGVIGSTATIVGSATGTVSNVARGVASITGDQKFVDETEKKRREMKYSNGGVMAGLKAGGDSMVSGFTSGFKGLVTKPMEQSKKGGALGFIKGMGQGIAGVVVNPVVGISEGISAVAHGINRQMSGKDSIRHVRPPRSFLRNNLDLYDETGMILTEIDIFSAMAQKFVFDRSAEKFRDPFMIALPIGYDPRSLENNDPYGIILSKKFFTLVTRKVEALWSFSTSDLSSIEVQDRVLRIKGDNGKGFRDIFCSDSTFAQNIYGCLANYRQLFINPHAMGNEKSPRSPPSELSKTEKIYSFGKSNSSKELLEPKVTYETILKKINQNFFNIQTNLPIDENDIFAFESKLDDLFWRSIFTWDKINSSMMAATTKCRCAAVLIINYSIIPLKLGVNLVDGKAYKVFPVGTSFDVVSHELKPKGGAVMIFAYSDPPNLFNKQHPKFTVKCPAFDCQITTREGSSSCQSKGGCLVQVREKSVTEYYGKFVITIH